MTTKLEKGADSRAKEITFRCKVCQESKALNDMTVLTSFFPPVVACKDCVRKIR